jgi:hypothetical protein
MPFVSEPRVNDDLTISWLAALERRYLSDLTPGEVARALRALSSCYVERRSVLARGGALASRGKRAAFALFYGPLHLLVTREILRSRPSPIDGITSIIDLGCGTGAAGVAWALASGARTIRGFDRHPWAIAESNSMYRHFHLNGRATRHDIGRARIPGARGTGIIAAYAVNELTTGGRAFLLTELLQAHARGARILIIEPIARRSAAWWPEWRTSFERAGGRADDWRFPNRLPPTQQSLARAAGLDPRELTAKTLWLPGS